jgi:hypothetical protein
MPVAQQMPHEVQQNNAKPRAELGAVYRHPRCARHLHVGLLVQQSRAQAGLAFPRLQQDTEDSERALVRPPLLPTTQRLQRCKLQDREDTLCTLGLARWFAVRQ